MRKSIEQFVAGEPLPAAKINSLVGSSEEVAIAASREHNRSGLHLHMRFEFAIGVFVLRAGSWALEFGDRMSILSAGADWIEVEIDLSDAALVAPTTIGLIATTDWGEECVYDTPSVSGRTVTTKIYLRTSRRSPTGCMVIAVGRRRDE